MLAYRQQPLVVIWDSLPIATPPCTLRFGATCNVQLGVSSVGAKGDLERWDLGIPTELHELRRLPRGDAPTSGIDLHKRSVRLCRPGERASTSVLDGEARVIGRS